MQFEQPAELNRYVDPTVPLTWAVRWKAIKPVLPMLACCSVLLVEQVAFRLWLQDRSLLSELPLLVVCFLFPAPLIMVAFEAQVRLSHRAKRRINLEPKRVSINPAKYSRIAWHQITTWRLEPLPNAPRLSKLTVEHCLDRGRKRLREWSIALRQPEQYYEFLSELEFFRQKGVNSAQLVVLPEPLIQKVSNRRLRSMVAAALGIYLLLHGLPLFLFGLLPPSGPSNEPRTSRSTATESAKVKKFVVDTFGSREAFRNFLLTGGGGLSAIGAALYFWGISTPRRTDESGAADKRQAAARPDPILLPPIDRELTNES
jgi:hypothetical protein